MEHNSSIQHSSNLSNRNQNTGLSPFADLYTRMDACLSSENHTVHVHPSESAGLAAKFEQALIAAGLEPNDVIPDGVLRRCPSKYSDNDPGWYLLCTDPPLGRYGDWANDALPKEGVSWRPDESVPLTEADQAVIAEHQRLVAEEKARRHAWARESAQRIWDTCAHADSSHPYLVRKQVKACDDLRVNGDELLVPVYNNVLELQGYQRIWPDGTKRHLFGTATTGHFFTFGNYAKTICLCEGLATGLSIHEATGYCIFVAFDAGNLLPVSRAIKSLIPDCDLIICADNDLKTERTTDKNPGTVSARRAAAETGARMAQIPVQDESITDFNDLACACGFDKVRQAIDDARAVTPSNVAECTDLGNARKLIERHGLDIRYCSDGSWYVWDGTRFARDDTGAVTRRTKSVVCEQFESAKQSYVATKKKMDAGVLDVEGKDFDKELKKFKARMDWYKKSQGTKSIAAAVTSASTEEPVVCRPCDLDADQMLLNVKNGILDLRTGELRPHRRADMQTKLAPVRFDPKAKAPLWEAFLDRIFAGDRDVISSVQRLLGYGLTGDVTEETFTILHGGGQNGKTTTMNAVAYVLGDYYRQVDTSLITDKPNGNDTIAYEERADLRGARLAVMLEPGDKQKTLDSGLLKQAVNNDRVIKGRKLRGHVVEFKATHKLILVTNPEPRINATDQGTWRRILKVPFDVEIPDHEKDTSLGTKLQAEASGILAWLVRGCLDWQRQGLNTCDSIKYHNEEYRHGQDLFRNFLDECGVVTPQAEIGTSELYARYNSWCARNNYHPKSHVSFSRELKNRGFETRHTMHGNVYIGIALKGQEDWKQAMN